MSQTDGVPVTSTSFGGIDSDNTFYYNGVTFGTFLKSKQAGRVVNDDAGRMVKFIEWSLSVTCIVTPADVDIDVDDTTGGIMERLRQYLTSPGGILRYSRKGFGEFAINDADADPVVWDCAYGPRPELISFTPVGDQLAAMVEWKVVVCIPEQENAATLNALMMLNFDADWNIDADGYHIITYTGALEIPITFRASANSENADTWREKAVPPLKEGFCREQKYHLSKDRRRLEFSITDKEQPVPLPVGTTMCEVRHRVTGKLRGGTCFAWNNHISGAIHVPRDRPRSYAWEKFYVILMKRLLYAKNSLGGISAVPKPAGVAQPTGVAVNGIIQRLVMPLDMEFEEDIFGRSSRFSINYVIIGASLANVVQISALWRDTGTDYTTWKNDAAANAQGPRGSLKIKFDQTTDLLIDLAHQPP